MLAPFGLILVLVATLAAFGLDVPTSVVLLARGAFGDRLGLATTVVYATPLVLTSLGMVVAWRAGMYNIGGEGQYIIGGLAGAFLAKLASGLPSPLLSPLILLATALGGAAYAALAGWMQIKRGVQVVIGTILLNFVALQLLSWAVWGPLQESRGQTPRTDRLANDVMLLRLDAQSSLHSGVFLALALPLLALVYLYASREGFRLRFVGANARAARAYGIDVDRTRLRAMASSGGLCGLAGGVTYLGVTGSVGLSFSENWGFLGIPAALLGGLNPIGTVLSSLWFGALISGGRNLTGFSDAKTTLVSAIQGVAVLGFVLFLALAERRRAARTAAEAAG